MMSNSDGRRAYGIATKAYETVSLIMYQDCDDDPEMTELLMNARITTSFLMAHLRNKYAPDPKDSNG